LYKALSVGPLVTHDFSATVHSSFERTVNLQTDTGLLFTITRADVPNLPSGIRADLPIDFSFERHVTIGEVFACRAGILRAGNTNLKINLRSAPVSNAQITLTTSVKLTAIWIAWQHLIDNAPINILTGGSTPIIGKKFLLELLSTKNASDTLAPLIGRGPGLTPAGDDFVVGFLAGNAATSNDGIDLKLNSSTTNDISLAALSEAHRGYFSAPILTLIESIHHGQSKGIEIAVADNLAIGATSGMAGALGVLMGLFQDYSDEDSAEIEAKIRLLFS